MILSIIVPMYKVEAFIEKCLNSCLNQNISKEEYEIVCVNDGSPDKSAAIAKRVAEENTNIRVIDRPNGGLSVARNTGLEHAKGEYIFFVDSDDWIQENCLGKISSLLMSEKPDVLCICAANVCGERYERRMSYVDCEATTGPDSMRLYKSPCAQFHIVRKAHLDKHKIRFYEGIYHEDVEYTPRMRYFAKKVCYLNDIIYYVYPNPNSITRTVNVKKVYDVLTVVVPHIHEFAEKYVGKKYRAKYNEIIGSAINTALTCNYPLGREDKEKINMILSNNRHFYDDYCNSTLLRYKIEGWLFKLFPNHAVEVFYLLSGKNKLSGLSRYTNRTA